MFHAAGARLGAQEDRFAESVAGVLPGERVAVANSEVLCSQNCSATTSVRGEATANNYNGPVGAVRQSGRRSEAPYPARNEVVPGVTDVAELGHRRLAPLPPPWWSSPPSGMQVTGAFAAGGLDIGSTPRPRPPSRSRSTPPPRPSRPKRWRRRSPSQSSRPSPAYPNSRRCGRSRSSASHRWSSTFPRTAFGYSFRPPTGGRGGSTGSRPARQNVARPKLGPPVSTWLGEVFHYGDSQELELREGDRGRAGESSPYLRDRPRLDHPPRPPHGARHGRGQLVGRAGEAVPGADRPGEAPQARGGVRTCDRPRRRDETRRRGAGQELL